jgi:hypothetical protein
MKAIIDLAVLTLTPVLYVLLLGGALVGLVVGVMLLLDSERVLRWNASLNRWYSTRQAFRKLDEPIDVKRFVYRWHRAVGVLVFAGAVFTLDVLAFGYQTGALVRAFRGLGNPTLLNVLFEALRIVLIVGNIAGLLVAIVLCFRPSLLKGVEALGDRQYSSRESLKTLEAMHYQPDDFVRARPRVVGVLFTLGSLYTLFALGLVLF